MDNPFALPGNSVTPGAQMRPAGVPGMPGQPGAQPMAPAAVINQQALQQNDPMRIAALVSQLQSPPDTRAAGGPMNALAQVGKAYSGSLAQRNNMPNGGWTTSTTPEEG